MENTNITRATNTPASIPLRKAAKISGPTGDYARETIAWIRDAYTKEFANALIDSMSVYAVMIRCDSGTEPNRN